MTEERIGALHASHITLHRGRARTFWPVLALATTAIAGLLAGCTTYRGPLTYIGPADEYPPAQWSATPSANQAQLRQGIYLMPAHHLVLVHIQIPDTSLQTLGPGAVHGAVGVWWVALDDRLPSGSKLVWDPACARFQAEGSGATFDIVGDYLAGPAGANLSRYPISLNPDDGSISVALSPADEISVPRSGGNNPPAYLAPRPAAGCGMP